MLVRIGLFELLAHLHTSNRVDKFEKVLVSPLVLLRGCGSITAIKFGNDYKYHREETKYRSRASLTYGVHKVVSSITVVRRLTIFTSLINLVNILSGLPTFENGSVQTKVKVILAR